MLLLLPLPVLHWVTVAFNCRIIHAKYIDQIEKWTFFTIGHIEYNARQWRLTTKRRPSSNIKWKGRGEKENEEERREREKIRTNSSTQSGKLNKWSNFIIDLIERTLWIGHKSSLEMKERTNAQVANYLNNDNRNVQTIIHANGINKRWYFLYLVSLVRIARARWENLIGLK